MSSEPDLHGLRMLTLIAERGSISAAAEQLDVSQQAVSLRIRRLEKQLQTRLLSRSPRGSHLTPTGELVVGWSRPMLEAADAFTRSILTLGDDSSGTLRVAASLTIAEHLLPLWIARWQSGLANGGPKASLKVANSRSVVEEIREGRADLGFIETPAIPKDLGSVTVGEDTIGVVVSPNHSWSSRKQVGPRELASTPLVLREQGSGTRDGLAQALEQADAPLAAEPAVIQSTTLGIRNSIMANIAPGALSTLAVAEDIRAGRLVLVPIEGIEIRRPLTAIWVGQRPSPAAEAFLRAVRANRAA